MADVADDAGNAHHLSGWIPEREYRERNVDRASILSMGDRIERADCAPRPDPLDVLGHLAAAVGLGEHDDVLSDDFLARVPEQRFGAPVPTDDGPVQRRRVNRVAGRFHDGRQQRPGSLRLVALRDVADDDGNGHHPAGRVPNGARRNAHRNPPSVPPQAQSLVLGNGSAL